MIILFPKRKGVKIATTLIFEAIGAGRAYSFVQGAIWFASSFGAITKKEAQALTQYLDENWKS